MKHAASTPLAVRHSLQRLGRDISMTRRLRRLRVNQMCERIGCSRDTYRRIERGDPSVGIGLVAMALYALGNGTPLGDVAAVDPDLLLAGSAEDGVIPKRVRKR